jgi:hypothetical protein
MPTSAKSESDWIRFVTPRHRREAKKQDVLESAKKHRFASIIAALESNSRAIKANTAESATKAKGPKP